jgi:hypothetical protein
VVIVSEGADEDVAAIARAVRRHGLGARVVDLDHERLRLHAPADGVAVLGANGAIPTPRLVCNRVGASGFGLASAAALARQPTDEWPTAHLAAREEQAVVLAAFEQWERSGATVLDPVRRVDRTMQRPLLRAQLQALGFSVGPVSEELRRTSVAGRLVLLDGEVVVAALGRGSQWKAVAVTPETADMMRQVAGVLQVRLASVDVRHRPGHPLHIAAWAARPRLAALGAATGIDVWSDVLTRLTAVSADPPRSFVTPDLVRNFSAV